jgi:hypothetical protein
MFPLCGQEWNLFLLESYCRRFSEQFRFKCLAVNNKNAGVIVRENSRLTYMDILADATAKSSVDLKEKTVLQFLYENGYIGKRSYSKINETINQAKILRG